MIASIGTGSKLKISKDKVELYIDEILHDQFNDQEVKDLVDFLLVFQNRPRKQYYLWKGNNGTIISHLTHVDDLPSITIGGGGKREKFTQISSAFVKDKHGNFKEF